MTVHLPVVDTQGIELPMEEFAVSATQVSTYELCPRKWAFKYIDKIDAPANKFAMLGVETHGHLESWLKESRVPVVRPASEELGRAYGLGTVVKGKLIDWDEVLKQEEKSVKLAHALIPHLPVPQVVDPANVEIRQFFSICGVNFHLASDLFMPKWRDDLPTVFDHKTGQREEFWLTPESMVRDVQATLYAGWAMTKIYTAPAVDLQWNYVRTKGSIITKPVVARVNGRSISERLGKTLETAREMEKWANTPAKGLDYPYNAGACEAFGGCPYKQRCNLQPADILRSVMSSQQPMTAPATQHFLGQLHAASNGQAPMAPPGAAPPPAYGQAPMAPPGAPPGYAAPQQGYAPAPMMPPPGPPPAPSNQMVNPPSYPAQTQQYAPQPAYPAPGPLQPPGAPPAPQQAYQASPAPPPQQQAYQPPPQQQVPPPPQPPPQEAAKGRGRPAKVDANHPWVAFACAAIAGGQQPQQAEQIADYMLQQLGTKGF